MRQSLALALAVALFVLSGAVRAPAEPGGDADFDAGIRTWLGADDVLEREEAAAAIREARAGVERIAAALSRVAPPLEDPGPGTTRFEQPGIDGLTHVTFLHRPPGAAPEEGWPLLLWLHGDLASAEAEAGREGIDLFAHHADEEGFVLLCPSTTIRTAWWSRGGEILLEAALRRAGRCLRLDRARILVAGRSDGASACFHLLENLPDPFAAFVAFVGNPQVAATQGGPAWPTNLDARPVLAFAAGRDPLYPAEGMREVYRELEEQGARLTLVVEPEAGHDLSFLERRWPQVLGFWRARPLPDPPRRLVWTTSRPTGSRRAWVEIVTLDPEASSLDAVASEADVPPPRDRGYGTKPGRVEAEILAGNRIEVHTDGVRRLRLYLEEGLIDFERELTVELDGREVFRGLPPTDPDVLLEEAWRDGGGVPPTRGVLDLDAGGGERKGP
jgi:poly(3-hydroxybutyrate) depolymerase